MSNQKKYEPEQKESQLILKVKLNFHKKIVRNLEEVLNDLFALKIVDPGWKSEIVETRKLVDRQKEVIKVLEKNIKEDF